jgi:lipid-A-disaccharide synthase-like uncharacterized protein
MTTSSGFLEPYLGTHMSWLYYDSYWWTGFGLIGNMLFGSRFIVQWLVSEKHNKIVVPSVFWHLSFWGSCIALIYGFHVDRLPIILGYLAGPLIYGRNLVLLGRTPGASH